MAAITKNTVTVTSSEWTMLSSSAIQTLQLTKGDGQRGVAIIFSDAQPNASVETSAKGHVLTQKAPFLNNSTGGTSWGRSIGYSISGNVHSAAQIAITEG